MLAQLSSRRMRPLLLMYAFAVVTVLTCAALLGAAALVPAPPAVLPIVAAVCIGGPLLVGWDLRAKLGTLRRTPQPLDASALTSLRQHLDSLPETPHPLGL
jgi:hypothetical protein